MTLHCTWRDMMREAGQRLAAAGVENAPRDARLLLAQALGVEPVDVILHETDSIDPVQLTQYESLVQRRLAGEPVSRIRGWREFYGRRFIVTPAVLDPRPETELLVTEGVKRLPQGGRVLDLGVGSGCILLSVLAERPDASGVGVDISPPALEVAKANAAMLSITRAGFVLGGWDAPRDQFDLVLSNPPYIATAELESLARDVREFDPHVALSPGDGAYAAYQAILAAMPAWLRPGGWIGVEFGLGQDMSLGAMMLESGLKEIQMFRDLAGHTRAAFGRRPGSAA